MYSLVGKCPMDISYGSNGPLDIILIQYIHDALSRCRFRFSPSDSIDTQISNGHSICPLDMHMSNGHLSCPLDPMDSHMSNGHFICPLDICVSIGHYMIHVQWTFELSTGSNGQSYVQWTFHMSIGHLR
jgi:hypothetical protein